MRLWHIVDDHDRDAVDARVFVSLPAGQALALLFERGVIARAEKMFAQPGIELARHHTT
jgi:hypothetical protein